MVAVKTAKGDGGETKPHVRGEPEQWILGSVARYISSLGKCVQRGVHAFSRARQTKH